MTEELSGSEKRAERALATGSVHRGAFVHPDGVLYFVDIRVMSCTFRRSMGPKGAVEPREGNGTTSTPGRALCRAVPGGSRAGPRRRLSLWPASRASGEPAQRRGVQSSGSIYSPTPSSRATADGRFGTPGLAIGRARRASADFEYPTPGISPTTVPHVPNALGHIHPRGARRAEDIRAGSSPTSPTRRGRPRRMKVERRASLCTARRHVGSRPGTRSASSHSGGRRSRSADPTCAPCS